MHGRLLCSENKVVAAVADVAVRFPAQLNCCLSSGFTDFHSTF